ncbi:hypothetical protein CASFOL_037384 [Castilleja foliolosa]|uniref:Uncharacterized protein n=1 Tax=Castilleja foliolosa TaxID=1961234 RepID=A0ABD3BPT9_9LAMI
MSKVLKIVQLVRVLPEYSLLSGQPRRVGATRWNKSSTELCPINLPSWPINRPIRPITRQLDLYLISVILLEIEGTSGPYASESRISAIRSIS